MVSSIICQIIYNSTPLHSSHDSSFASSMIGKKVKVFWPVDEQWYTGVVQEYNSATGEHKLMYPDGDTEWVKIGENGNSGAAGGPSVGAGISGNRGGVTKVPVAHQPPVGPGGAAGGHGSPNETRGRTPERGNEPPYNISPNKHAPQAMYSDIIGGMQHPANFNPYHQHPSFPGMGHPYGPPYGAPGGGFHPFDMRTALPFPPPSHRSSPSRIRSRGGESMGDHMSSKDAISPSHAKSTPDSSDKGPSSGGKKKSGPKTWSKEEDTQLLSMVQKMRMPIKWSLVSQSMPDRTGKQCRERYVNHLNPRLKSCDWSPAEDATIFHLYNTCGSQWAKMSKMIPGRTDNGIKNRFHNLRRQLEREDEHRVRLSKPEDFPDEVQLDRIREFPKHLRGKCDGLWEMSDGVGVLAAQSVLGGSFARNAGRFGPFKKADPAGEQCARCGLFAPSTHCGTEICTKSKWCIACTRLPPHMCSNILRECLNLRLIEEDTQDEQENKLIKAGALNLALADA
jgi:hypothetical protein